MLNLNYLLNKKYYSEFNFEFNSEFNFQFTHEHFGKCNDALTKDIIFASDEKIPPIFFSNSFTLKTVYPGLVFGLGNIHITNNDMVHNDEEKGAEIKLGFSLDYTTGLPFIPGSTVKGVLHSAFRKYGEAIWQEFFSVTENPFDKEHLKKLENEIFGDSDENASCVFFDAVPVQVGKEGRLFGLDNITPHPDPLKNPRPITMLKIIPNVIFLFRFDLTNYSGDKEERQHLENLFKTILTTLGIGAKTNVGYGVMESIDEQNQSAEWKMLSYKKRNGTQQQNHSSQTQEGICEKCGMPTKPIKKLENEGKIEYHKLCYECNQKKGR